MIDTREQLPLSLAPLKTVTATLTTGDYSILGLEQVVAVERKSLTDLLQCVGRDRRRFEREVQRLLVYPVRALVIESTWDELEWGAWHVQVRPQAVVGSVLGWMSRGLPAILAGTHENAGRYVARFLLLSAQRRWREARRIVVAANEG